MRSAKTVDPCSVLMNLTGVASPVDTIMIRQEGKHYSDGRKDRGQKIPGLGPEGH